MSSHNDIIFTLSDNILNSIHININNSIIHSAERILLDTCACAFGAVDEQPVQAVRAWASNIKGTPEARIIGSAETSSVMGAAMANTTMARQLDINDAFWGRQIVCHPSDNIGGILAVADAVGATSDELLRAILVAFEIHIRVTEFSRESWYMEGGWDVAFFLPLATAAGVGTLLKLDRTQLANAMAIAASNAILGEIRVGHISTMKAVASGRAVAHGVEAAYLAAYGVTGPQRIFEGSRGLSALILGECDWDILLKPINEWRLPETCIKQYPAAYIIHNAIDAALALRAKHGILPEDVQEVEVTAYKWLIDEMVNGGGGKSRYDIDVRETADHSLPYCVAISLVDGEYTVAQLETPRWLAPEVKAMLSQVKCFHDPALDPGFPQSRPTRVKILLKDGRSVEQLVPYPKGDPRAPLTDDDIADKFRSLSRSQLDAAAQDRVIDTTLNLHERNASDFFASITKQQS